MDDLEYEEFY